MKKLMKSHIEPKTKPELVLTNVDKYKNGTKCQQNKKLINSTASLMQQINVSCFIDFKSIIHIGHLD